MSFTELLVVWSGFTGAPGYTKMRFDGALDSAGASTAAANMKTWLNAFSGYIPQGATLTWSSTATIHADNGTQTGAVAITTVPAPLAGASAAAYAGGSGAQVTWLTGAFAGGRAVKGRTYLVPFTSAAFEPDGTINSTALAALRGFSATFATSTPAPVVWSRKPSNAPTEFLIAHMTGASVPDKAALLRSRRT